MLSSETTAAGKEHDQTDNQGDGNAARTIQRNYRGYRGRREMKGCGMSAQGRWREVLKDAQYHNLTAARPKDENSNSSTRWTRLTAITARATNDEREDSEKTAKQDGHSTDDSFDYYLEKLRSEQGQKHSKTMGLDYWLEMVDRKHRYGTNLLKYHNVWSKSDTQENFFYWLDEGEGKHEDLEDMPRDKLEKQQLSYCSKEERYEYLIEVGDDGLLRWAKSGEKVTTHAPEKGASNEGVSGQTETSNHVTDDLHNARGILKAAGHAVPAPLAKLIDMNQDKASWIFVVDTQFRIYAGIKESGGFQHSSFLHGSRVLSAGLISIQDGQLLSLSPHSGHYRPTAENFWITAKCLEAEGVDMSQASIAGSYTLLRGAELYRDSTSYISGVMDTVYNQKDKLLSSSTA